MSTEDPEPIPMKEEAASAPAPPPVSSPPSSQGSVTPHETLATPNSAAAADNRTFSQLLAGAMVSPVGSPRGAPMVALPVPMVAVPCFLAPATILDSPGFAGQFAMTHQAVLATVTAQAQMQLQAAYPSSSEASANSFSQPVPISPAPLQQRPSPLSEGSVSTPMSTEPAPSEPKSQSTQIVVKTSSDDGYNWRKYGQKQVKSSDRSRSYYRCTNVNCFAKKKVERCPDGRETEIIFRGQHNHEPPQRTKYQKEKVVRTPTADNEILDLPRNEVNESDLLTSNPEHNSGNEPEQQLYCSSDCEGDAAVKTEEEHGDEPDLKRRLTESSTPYSAPVLKTIKEPKIVVQSACETTSISDGYKWRKYGQKLVKGNPNPRSYYRCTHNGCPVRKHVERASDDAKSVLITYEGKHNHEQPSPKNRTDPPSTTLLLTAAPATETSKDVQLQTSESSVDKKTSTDGELVRDKASLESAETLLSMGFNSSSGEETTGASSDGIKRPQFSENRAAVPVQNS